MNRLVILVSTLLWTASVIAQSPAKDEMKLHNPIAPSPNATSLVLTAAYKIGEYTGTSNISIPIYEVRSNDITVPVSLSYNGGRGLKVKEEASWVGLGWALQAGGIITRSMNGRDDLDPATIYFGKQSLSFNVVANSSFISGSVFEFEIPQGLGFAYCRVLDFRHIREFDGTLGYVFDFIHDTPLIDLGVLNDQDLLFGAQRLDGIPVTRGKYKWKLKGVLISAERVPIPDFKYSQKFIGEETNFSKIKEWFAVKNISEYSETPCSYDKVRHLESIKVVSQRSVEIRTAMELLRLNDKDPRDYFDMDDLTNWNVYRSMINVPLYKTIPREIRGKALC